MAEGEDWGPRGFDWSTPSNTQGKKKEKKKCFVRRTRGIPWAVSLNKPGVKHPPAPPSPHTLHFSSHSLTLALYPPSPFSPLLPPFPTTLPPPPLPFCLQSDRGIIVPQGFRWCDISVTWRRAVSCSPEKPHLPVGCRGGRRRESGARERDAGWLGLFVDFCHCIDAS